MSTKVIISLVIFVFVVLADAKSIKKNHPAGNHPICRSMVGKQSFLFPMLCMSDEEYAVMGSRGAEFRKLNPDAVYDPILLIPGLGGSGMNTKRTNARTASSWCPKTTDWFRTWIALGTLANPFISSCWYDDLSVVFHPSNKTYSNKPGIEVEVIGFGRLDGVDYLDTDFSGNGITATSYFAPLIKDLVAVGYRPGVDLRGAPFDWRLAENPHNLYARMVNLIEEMYQANGNKRVHLLAHSMGNIHTTLMLEGQPQVWKDKYIDSFIAVAGPWGGSAKSLRAAISGDNFGMGLGDWISLVDKHKVATLVRQAGGVVMLFPDFEFWNTTELVRTPTRVYTTADYLQLFNDIGSPITGQVYQTVQDTLTSLKAPGVPLHCLYGVDYPTEVSFNYKNGFNKDPEITYSEEGDGTVPDSSLRKCKEFAQQQSQAVEVKEFDLADHMTVLNDEELLQYVLQIVASGTTAQNAM